MKYVGIAVKTHKPCTQLIALTRVEGRLTYVGAENIPPHNLPQTYTEYCRQVWHDIVNHCTAFARANDIAYISAVHPADHQTLVLSINTEEAPSDVLLQILKGP